MDSNNGIRVYTLENGSKVEQKALVVGQVGQLFEAFDGLLQNLSSLDESEGAAFQFIAQLGGRLPEFCQIILCPEGKHAGQKDAAFAEAIRWGLSPETAIQAVIDFFSLTRVSALQQKITELTTAFSAVLGAAKLSTSELSTGQSSDSPEDALGSTPN